MTDPPLLFPTITNRIPAYLFADLSILHFKIKQSVLRLEHNYIMATPCEHLLKILPVPFVIPE